MRHALRSLAVAAALFVACRAHAGGFELDQLSARGTATVGAQTAVASDPSAVYYNPGALTYQRGLNAMGGVQFLLTDISVRSQGVSVPTGGLKLAPMLYVTQRLDSHFAIGVGVFSNFLDRLDYPTSWPGATGSTGFEFSTTTINPTVAIRPIPQLSIGFGLDIVPASLTLTHADTLGPTGALMDAVGFGGNVGIYVIAVPRWLTLGATYRSAVGLDFSGVGDTMGTINHQYNTSGSVTLPHNLSFGASTRPIDRLTVSLDAKVTLWHDLPALTVAFVEPRADPATAPQIKDTTDLNLRDSYGFRAGAEYRPTDTFWLSIGLGYDRTPVRRGWLVPIMPDNDRVLVGIGMGGYYKWLEIGAAYSATIVTSRTSSNPVPGNATYDGVRHLLTVNLGLHFPHILEKKIGAKY